MSQQRVVVIGASAGGIEAASRVFAALPADYPGSIFIVVHIPPHAVSVLPQIFARSGKLPAVHPSSGTESIRPGTIYVAPPDYHMLLGRGTVSLVAGPKENSHRPAVDPLFRSAALAYGPAAVGVILSGSLDDGSAGLATIKAAGGLAVAQTVEDAIYPSMPTHAAASVALDHALPAPEIGLLLAQLAREPVARPLGDPDPLLVAEVGIGALDPAALHSDDHPGIPSGFGCPDCGGALWEIPGRTPLRFRCRVGHAWSVGSLMADQAEKTESALWTALRTLEERASLCQRLARRFLSLGNSASAARFQSRVDEVLASAEVLRGLIATGRPLNLDVHDVPAPAPPAGGAGLGSRPAASTQREAAE